MAESDLRAREMELEYRSFLDDEATDGLYHDKVMKMIKNEQTRLLVKINDTRKNPNFKARAEGLIENSAEEIVAFQRALKEYVISIDPQYGRQHLDFFIGLCGSFGSRHVTPRTLNARFLNNTVCVEGIVSKLSVVKPKIVRSHHYNEVTKKQLERRHFDLASLEYQPSTNTLEAKDENGMPLVFEPGMSVFKDHQTLTLQEMPEVAPAGQLPRTVDVILENDLIDNCKPGDRVQIVGTYRSLPNKQGNFTSCMFRTVVIANHVEQLSKEVAMTISADDIKAIQRESRSRRYDIFDRLARSLAPSIYGHENVKKAILCLLLGGVEKHLQNGTRLRGDINVLLIGDPSVAKSQLLRFVLGCAPRAIPTTGRGSSGVGLTAAVTTDPETGDRRLEAGAMVLADRGIVCVDEFDKMSDIDRTAIHEVMEQGRVTICKAGINARLNARCSVLAAANPVCGNYDPYKLPMVNIGMQDSLLSRFDLLFIMLDQHNRENDLRIAQHVLRVHRYRPQDQLDGEATEINVNANYLTTMMDEDEENRVTEIYEKRNPIILGRNRNDKIFTLDFLRKYIHIAKKVKPVLTEEACLMIGEHYWNLREIDPTIKDLAKTQPITPRSLETLIRLATAHAKARLDTKVTADDAAAAIELIQHSCYHKVLSRARIRPSKRPKSTDGTDDDESEPDEDTSRDQPAQTRNKRARVDGDSAAETADQQMDTEERTEFVSHLTDAQKESIKSKLPDFLELVNDISRKQHGAQTLDMDLVYVGAEKSLKINKMETDILVLLMQEKEMAVLDSNHLYLLA